MEKNHTKFLFDHDVMEDIRIKTFLNFKHNHFYDSVKEKYIEHQDWWSFTREALNNTTSITSKVGKDLLMYINTQKPTYEIYQLLFLSDPMAFEFFDTWVLLQVIQECEFELLDYCSQENREESITTELSTILTNKSKSLRQKYNEYLSAIDSELSLQKLELQIQNRESKTGGDFALILEWRDGMGGMNICPMIFQAKRAVHIDADISKHHIIYGYQFDVLSKSKCNPAYIFYNCDTQKNIKWPRLPTVKSVSSITNFAPPYKTNVIENTLSLSVYMLQLMSDKRTFKTKSRKEALDQILIGVEESSLKEIVTLSVDPNAIKEYTVEYNKILAQSRLHKKNMKKINDNNNDYGM